MTTNERIIAGFLISVVLALQAHNFATVEKLETQVIQLDTKQIWIIELIKSHVSTVIK